MKLSYQVISLKSFFEYISVQHLFVYTETAVESFSATCVVWS